MFRILTVHGWKYFKKFKINQNYIRLAHIFVTFGHDIGLAFAETLLTSLKSKDFLSISGKQLWRQTRICLLSLRFFFSFWFCFQKSCWSSLQSLTCSSCLKTVAGRRCLLAKASIWSVDSTVCFIFGFL